MARYLIVIWLAALCAVRADEVTVAWDCPTTNTDGSALVDVAGYMLFARRCDEVRVVWSNAVWRVSGRLVTNLVVGRITWIPGPLVETVTVPALTNAPAAGSEQAVAFTNLVRNRVYEARGVAVNSRNAMSEPSDGLIFGTGTPAPSRLKLKMVVP